MSRPAVDVIIPVHDVGRRFEDAVESASTVTQGVATHVFVILHNTTLDDLAAARREGLERRGVRLLSVHDGIKSPSGPRNAGIEAAESTYVSFLDSDDVLGGEMLGKLVETIEATDADLALPSIITPQGPMSSPLAFYRRRAVLDPVRHELFRRSHSFGLIRRTLLERTGIRYPPAIRTGQDLVFMSQLYAQGRTAIALDAAYHLRDHDRDRLTVSPLPQSDQVAAVRHILDARWLSELEPAMRHSLLRRLVTLNLARGWRYRCAMGHEPSAALFAELRDRALEIDPVVFEELSLRDRRTLRFEPEPPPLEADLWQLLSGLVPHDPGKLLSRGGPTVLQAKSLLVKHRLRRLHQVST